MRPPRELLRHLVALCAVIACIGIWLHPLWLNGDAVPGTGPGDNLAFVWNLWWTRYALQSDASVFFTPLLFYPFGADLTLHTNTLLPAVAASGFRDPVVAQNTILLVHAFLNFVATYALAWYETRNWPAALLAATIFGWSPFVSAHLAGHFNLIAAWVLPLAALAAIRLQERPSLATGVALGAVLACAAYVDYYYFVYAVVLSGTLLLSDVLGATRQPPNRFSHLSRGFLRAMLVLLAIDLAVLVWVLTTGGGEFRLLSLRVSARGVANPIAGAWLLALTTAGLTALRGARLHLRIKALRPRIAGACAAGIVLLIGIAPLAWRAARIWRAGEYATQQYFWRSAPPGVDLATLLLGNPFNALYGRLAETMYARLHVNLVEQVAWLTPGMLVLAVIGWRATRRSDIARWTLPMVVFGVWALGPYVEVAGQATSLWLPAVLLRWVPIINNARIPARAVIVVYLAGALLAARGFVYLTKTAQRRTLAWALAGVVFLDLVPRRLPLYSVERPDLYHRLRDAPPGAVCELPFGLRDGFGEVGQLDPRSMYFQTLHEHALVGGFEARMPRGMVARYEALPVIGTLLKLSGGTPLPAFATLPTRAEAADALDRAGIRYVVLNRRTSPPDLLQFAYNVLPLREMAQDAERTLFAVDGPR